MKYTREKLENDINDGKTFKYLFFWGHRKSQTLTSSCFSQWWQQSFIVNGITYQTAEHFMMAEKARLFEDKEAEAKILASSSPGEAKKIGRQVLGFDEKVWVENRMNIVVKGNVEKFSQNLDLKEYLLNTHERILVEASPVDNIWGIGMDKDNQSAFIPSAWKGLNLLGFALMEVRDILNESLD